MAEDKTALEQSISELHDETENKTQELESADIKNKEEIQQVIERLKQNIVETNELNNKKFKWAFSIAGASLIINMVLITLHICGII
ncbi:MAG: hypothetical protein HUK00_01120 [Bacteroidaceae bacterium]|nr:hypothetical protein [Bacteroidaceae bacterium]